MQNKHIFLWGSILALVLLAVSCKTQQQTTKKPKGEVILKFKKESVTKSEFERVYQKNNGGYEEAKKHTAEQYQEYLDLYINFKRKVFEAEEEGLDTTTAFKREFETYRKQLAQPYLTEKDVEERILQEAYERSKYILNANHILVKLPPDPNPVDTLNAYKKIIAFRDSVVKGGSSFESIANRYSDDPSARQNNGYLGYFSVFNMVYPFETGAYNTKIGSVSLPIRSRFGYHLIRVNEKLEVKGLKRSSHILIRIGDRYGAKDTASAIRKVNELYNKLKNGADFAELAKEHSDDPTSAPKGGDLGTGRLLPIMDSVKLKLDLDGYSKPFNTAFGWHIMKVTEESPIKSFEEVKPELKSRVERDSRSRIGTEVLIEKIKTETAYTENRDVLKEFKKSLDLKFSRGVWRPDTSKSAFYQKELFSIGSDDKKVTRTLQDMIDFYLLRPLRSPKLSAAQAAETVYKSFTEKELLSYEEARLPEKNDEYRFLLKEYRDGILLFTLMEQKVWKKAVEDTVGLKKFYGANKEMFQADEMIDVREYRSTNDTTIKEVLTLLKEGKMEAEIDSMINEQSSLAVRITTQSYEKGKNDADGALFTKPIGHISDIIQQGARYKVLVLKEKYPAGVKPFDKAKSECITKYQDYLEKAWLESLSKKYPVQVNDEVFQKLFQ